MLPTSFLSNRRASQDPSENNCPRAIQFQAWYQPAGNVRVRGGTGSSENGRQGQYQSSKQFRLVIAAIRGRAGALSVAEMFNRCKVCAFE